MNTWTVIKQARKAGNYYSAILKGTGKSRSVTIGYLEGDPATAELTARLRSIAEVAANHGHGVLSDDLVASIIKARTDADARLTAALVLDDTPKATPAPDVILTCSMRGGRRLACVPGRRS